MFVGELGNFAAYGFAPAILVAPLGTVALVSLRMARVYQRLTLNLILTIMADYCVD
jgi:Magnesium transporter NIPA